MEINEALNQSLFFIGAGASYDANCKMSSQMFTALKDLVCEKSKIYFSETECEAIKFLLSCLHYQSEWRTLEVNRKYSIEPNIEELALLIRRIKNRDNFLPYPVTGNWADKLISLETRFKEENTEKIGYGLFNKIEDTIKNKLLPIWLEVDNTNFLTQLDSFFSSCQKLDFTLEVFSLNNDLVFEKHYSEQKAKPYRGFYSGEWRGFENKTNDEEFNRINLYKLHGSLDWIRLSDGTIWEKDKYVIEDQNEEDSRIEHDPFIIFGHGTKFFSVEPFFSLIQNFREKLRERKYFFVIGYSFFDPYINNLLIQAIKEAREENKKIIIVNPEFAVPPLDKNIHFTGDTQYKIMKMSTDNVEAKRLLTDYLEDIQRNAFYSELPEFNIKQIPTEAIYYLLINTKEFINKFFSDSGNNFINFIESLENERIDDLPFK